MICSRCGGAMTWRGPFSNLTHTECAVCGGKNCQVMDEIPDEPCLECDGSGKDEAGGPCPHCDGTGTEE